MIGNIAYLRILYTSIMAPLWPQTQAETRRTLILSMIRHRINWNWIYLPIYSPDWCDDDDSGYTPCYVAQSDFEREQIRRRYHFWHVIYLHLKHACDETDGGKASTLSAAVPSCCLVKGRRRHFVRFRVVITARIRLPMSTYHKKAAKNARQGK